MGSPRQPEDARAKTVTGLHLEKTCGSPLTRGAQLPRVTISCQVHPTAKQLTRLQGAPGQAKTLGMTPRRARST